MFDSIIHTAQLLSTVLGSDQSLSEALQKLFREQRKALNSSTREEIANLAYAVLRRYGLYTAAYSSLGFTGADRELIHIFSELTFQGREHTLDELRAADLFSTPVFSERFKKHFRSLLDLVRSRPWEKSPPSTRVPEWVFKELKANTGDRAMPIATALTTPAPLTLRVNTIKISRDSLLRKFSGMKILARATPYSPIGIHVSEKTPLHALPIFEKGLFEIQDEGSQLLSFILDPKRGEKILDACAGAGGKTLQIAALMENRGRILASDPAGDKLSELRNRAERAGVEIVKTRKASTAEGLETEWDRVFIDAPCSGSGIFRRHPERIWQLRETELVHYSDKQSAILETYSKAVRPGGRLLYATCSIFEAENTAVVHRFLKRNPDFSILPLEILVPTIPSVAGIRDFLLRYDHQFLRLFPENSESSDGFFAAVFERRDLGVS